MGLLVDWIHLRKEISEPEDITTDRTQKPKSKKKKKTCKNRRTTKGIIYV